MVAYNLLPDNAPVEGVPLNRVLKGLLRSLVIPWYISADFRRFTALLGATPLSPNALIFSIRPPKDRTVSAWPAAAVIPRLGLCGIPIDLLTPPGGAITTELTP
jgi:hypothetical protein